MKFFKEAQLVVVSLSLKTLISTKVVSSLILLKLKLIILFQYMALELMKITSHFGMAETHGEHFGEKKGFLKYIEAIIPYKLKAHVLGLFLKTPGVITLKIIP